MRHIQAINNGTIIDHVKAGFALKVLDALNLLAEIQNQSLKIMIGCNFDSETLKSKDIIKISNKFLTADELNKIAVIAPAATVSIIKESKVIEKYQLEVPASVENILKCTNQKCITNHEAMTTMFHPLDDLSGYRCHYCEKLMPKDKLAFR
jgi:aspartate carbamoyltransferase regulatory subunit